MPPRDRLDAIPPIEVGPSAAVAKSTTTTVKLNAPAATLANTRMEDYDAGLYLRYPLENQDYYKAAIRFSLYSIDPYKINANAARQIADTPFLSSLLKKEATDNAADTARLAAAADAEIPPEAAFGAGGSDITAHVQQEEELRGTNRDLSLKPENLHQNITLYFPPGVLINDAVIYDTNATLGPGGATAMAGVNNQSSLLSSVAKGVTEGAADLFNLI